MFIVGFKENHDGLAPTFREIWQACGIKSPRHVKYYLNKLETEGRIQINYHIPRTIKVIGGEWSLIASKEGW